VAFALLTIAMSDRVNDNPSCQNRQSAIWTGSAGLNQSTHRSIGGRSDDLWAIVLASKSSAIDLDLLISGDRLGLSTINVTGGLFGDRVLTK
jgi:hypothetical protein